MLASETLPGYPDLIITSRENAQVQVSAGGPPPNCTVCGLPLRKSGTRVRTLTDLPWGFTPQTLTVTVPHWRCRNECPGQRPLGDLTEPARPGEGTRHGPVTARLRAYLEDAWGRGTAVRTLARMTGLGEGALYTRIGAMTPLLDHHWRRPEMLSQLQYVGIDEIFWRQQPLVVVMNIAPGDLSVGRVIDILPTRDPEVVERFLHHLREAKAQLGEPDWRPVIATDMWNEFRVAVQRVFQGRAVHVADRFHIAAKIVEDLKDAVNALVLDALTSGSGIAPRPGQRASARATASLAVRAYLSALKTGTSVALPPDLEAHLHGPVQGLITLALELHHLWDLPFALQGDGSAQLAGLQAFSRWVGQVHAWNTAHTVERRPGRAFARLVYLLDTQGWSMELTQAFRQEALPVIGPARDLQHAQSPAARPAQGRLVSTARVENVNRRIRQLETHSPNHRRVPSARTDWTRWQEERQFRKYRHRLLYALNMPPTPLPTLSTVLVPALDACPCGAEASSVGQTLGPARSAWDVPLAGARVRATWQPIRHVCPACGEVREAQVPHTGTVTLRLLHHLQESLTRDEPLTALHLRTGASRQLLQALRRDLPEPEVRFPENLGVMEFLWKRTPRLALFDVRTGRLADLLPDAGHAALAAWLAGPGADRVVRVWVERPELLPGRAGPPDWALDTFASARLFQRSIQALQRDVTSGIPVGRLRTPALKGLRRVLTLNPAGNHMPMAYRLDALRIRALRSKMLARHPALTFGLGRIQALKETLLKTPTDAAVSEWLASLEVLETAGIQEHPTHEAAFRRATSALGLTRRLLEPGQTTRAAILEGHRVFMPQRSELSGKELLTELSEEECPNELSGEELLTNLSGEELHTLHRQRMNLSRVRRRLKDLKELRLYRGRDWNHLRSVALRTVGP